LAGLLALQLAWHTALERCHGDSKFACAEDLHGEAEYLRAESRLLAIARADKAASAPLAFAVPEEATRSGGARAYEHVMIHGSPLWLLGAIGILAAAALLMSSAIGANTFSLHGMYGNRLVRAYLGAGRRRRHPHWFTGFDPDDN